MILKKKNKKKNDDSIDINEQVKKIIISNKNYKIDSIINQESKSNLDHMNYKNCINFSRRQLNNEGLEYNYMVFKPKKNAYVDTSTINIYLKCEDEILAIIPYNDYFNLRCDENRENCIL
jgi:hypothetical protein